MGVYSFAAQASHVRSRKQSWQPFASPQRPGPSPFSTKESFPTQEKWSLRRTAIFTLLASAALWLCILFGWSYL